MSDFATLLKQYRTAARISQRRLEAMTGIDRGHISRMEGDTRHPGRDIVERIADALNLYPMQRDLLMHAAGFAHGTPQEIADNDLRTIAGFLHDHAIPEALRDVVRSGVRSLIASAAYVSTESRAA
jgi:hypothetical protein